MAMPARLQTDPRFRRRRALVVRSKRRRLLVGLTASVTLLAIVWGMFWSPLLVVRKVRVVGAKHATTEEVVAATGLIGASENLLLLSTDDVAARVAELPWVRAAEVDRMLPGSVRVRIIERKPALLLAIGAARWTLDKRGNVLAAGATRTTLPVLAGVEVGEIEPGLKLLTPEAADALRLFRALPDGVRNQVSGMFAPTRERLTLSLRQGIVVRFGAAERIAAKVKVLKALLRRIVGRGLQVTYVDVRVPSNPALAAGVPGDSAVVPDPTEVSAPADANG